MNPPLFNLGTELLDRKRWTSQIDRWLDMLGNIVLPGITTTVAENKVFPGRGELCRRLTALDPAVLVLPTEISKIYMDEHTGREYPHLIDSLSIGLARKMEEHSEYSIIEAAARSKGFQK